MALSFEGYLAVFVVPVSLQCLVGLQVGNTDPRLLGEEDLANGRFPDGLIVRIPLPELQLVDLGGTLVDVADVLLGHGAALLSLHGDPGLFPIDIAFLPSLRFSDSLGNLEWSSNRLF